MSLYTVARASAATLAASVASITVAEQFGSDHGVVRSYRFWRGMLPIYLHYRLKEHELRDISDPEVISAGFAPLHERYSPQVEGLTLSLRGFYYKLAQIVSTRDDFLPEKYRDWMQTLQDKSRVFMPPTEVQVVVEASTGKGLTELFEAWDHNPIGAASVGQVHKARWRETGEEVAVKILFPGVERKFRSDIETVEMFCRYLMPQNVAYFKEIKKQFSTEFDARGEAENLQEVYGNMCHSEYDNLVEVPKPIYASKDVLVMRYLPGDKLVDGVRSNMKQLAEARGIDAAEMEGEQKRLLEEGLIERKDVRESAAATRRLHRVISLRDRIVNAGLWVLNHTLWPVLGEWIYWSSVKPVNLGEVMDTLVRVHGYEIFHDGAFNGDPHPGNVLLMPDGKLGLVDYGQVKRMKVSDRIIYAKLIIALDKEDRAEVVRIMKDEMHVRTKNMNDDVLYRTAAFFNCRDSDDVTMGMNVSEFMDWLETTDPVRKINDEFVMVGRVSVLLRGVANAFGMKIRISRYWREEAERFLKAQQIEY